MSRHSSTQSVPLPQLAAAKKVAAETGVPYTSLRDIALRGEIAVVRIGRAWYFDRADVGRWIETRKERIA
jgi:hypothetical protein